MSTFKYVLKKILGGLKMAVLVAPIVLTAGGFIGTVTGAAIRDSKDKEMTKIVREFKETNTYDLMLQNKKEELDIAFAKGEITEEEHAVKVDYLVSDESTRQILQESDSYLKPEYTKCLKVKEGADIAAYVSLGSLGLGIISGAVFYPGYFEERGIGYDIKYSAQQDFRDADYELFH